MAKSHEIKKKAEALYRNIKDLYAKETLTAEDSAKFDQWNTEFDALMADAKKFEDFEKKEIQESQENTEIEKNLKKGDIAPEQRKEFENLALKEFVLTGKVSPELQKFMAPAQGEKDDKSMIDAEYKRLGVTRANVQSTTDGKGGYTIATGFQRELEKGMQAYGGMLQVSRIWKTAKGNTIEWPLANDVSNRAYLLAEAGNAETSAEDIDFTQQQFEAYKITSGMLRLNSELVEDSEFNIVGEVQSFLEERMGRGINYYATLADGSSKPKGITIAAPHGNNTANDTVLDPADFLGLEHDVDPAYRVGATWMFHDSVLKEIKRASLAATVGYPLWVPSFKDGAPSTILNYAYTINQDMAAFTYNAASANDNAKIALFGNFKKFIIRTVNNMRLVRLNERFGDTDQIAIVAFWRIDSDLLLAGNAPVKYMRVSGT
jgi:HK97 family phage major capsid protein